LTVFCHAKAKYVNALSGKISLVFAVEKGFLARGLPRGLAGEWFVVERQMVKGGLQVGAGQGGRGGRSGG
jgi:hypothetical protein